MPKLYQSGHKHTRSLGVQANKTQKVGKDGRAYTQVNLSGVPQSSTSRTRVAYWAGMRVEGGLSPFNINMDDLTKWNETMKTRGL